MSTEQSLVDLKNQREELNARIAEAQKAEKADAIIQIKEAMQLYDISVEDLTAKARKASSGNKGVVAPKYQLPTGETWTGRGKAPKAFEEAKALGTLDQYLINKPEASEAPAEEAPKKKKVKKVKKVAEEAAPMTE